MSNRASKSANDKAADPREDDDREGIDESSEESFPASDPPSWTMGKSARHAASEGTEPANPRGGDQAQGKERNAPEQRRQGT